MATPTRQSRSRARTVVTKTTTTVNQVLNHSTCSQHELIEQYWDRRPKTDYTYSRSGSYSPTDLEKPCISPNMSRRHLGCVDRRQRSPSPGQRCNTPRRSPCQSRANRYSPGRRSASSGRRSVSPCRRSPARNIGIRGRPAGSSVKTVSSSVTKSLGASAAKQGTLDDTNMLNIHNVVNLSMSESGQLRQSNTPNKGMCRGGRGDDPSITRSGRAYSKARSMSGKKKQHNSSFMDLFTCRQRSPHRASPRRASPCTQRRASPGKKGKRRSRSRSSHSPSPVCDADNSAHSSQPSVRFRSKNEMWTNEVAHSTGWLSWLWGGSANQQLHCSESQRQQINGRAGNCSQRQMEKRREYAGESTQYKENQLSHLYGLDGTDCEDYYSDTDSIDGHQVRKRHTQVSVLTRVYRVFTYPARYFFTAHAYNESDWATSSSRHKSHRSVSTVAMTTTSSKSSFSRIAAVPCSVLFALLRLVLGVVLLLLYAPIAAYRWIKSRFTGHAKSSYSVSSNQMTSVNDNIFAQLLEAPLCGGASTNSTRFVGRSTSYHEHRQSSVHVTSTSYLSRIVTAPRSLVVGFCRLCAGILMLLCTAASSVYGWTKSRVIGGACVRWLCWIFNKLYCLLVHGVIADLFFLSKTSIWRRRCGLCCLIPLFLFLPLLFLGGYVVVHDRTIIAPVATYCENMPLISYFSYFTSAVVHKASDASMSDSELEARVKHMVHNLEKQRQDLAAEQRTHWGVPGQGQEPLGLAHCAGSFKDGSSQFEHVVRRLVREEMVRFQADAGGGGTADGQAAASAQQAIQIGLLQEKLDELRNKSEILSVQINQASRSEGSEHSSQHLQLRLSQLQADTLALKQTQQALLDRLRLCCRDDAAVGLLVTAGVQQHLAKVMLASTEAERKRIRGESPPTSSANPFPFISCNNNISETFGAWLAASYVSPQQLDSRVASLAAKIQRQVAVTARASAMQAVATADAARAAANDAQQDSLYDGINDQHIEALIRNALAVYDADKTGKVDFALESAGGSILSTRCSQTYHRRTAQLSLFGIPLWYASNSARTIIQPGMYPGQCWAFRGSTGYVVIQLAGLVDITAVSMEHVSKALSPSGQIDSAPKDFCVWGLASESDTNGVLLANHTYQEDGPPLQYFNVAKPSSTAYRIVELQILSNHGNKEYTCLYRFRVHGHLSNW